LLFFGDLLFFLFLGTVLAFLTYDFDLLIFFFVGLGALLVFLIFFGLGDFLTFFGLDDFLTFFGVGDFFFFYTVLDFFTFFTDFLTDFDFLAFLAGLTGFL